MRIQHNISAANAHRQLGNNNSFVSKNLEKLSSGYRINRAGDDAAGLAISEKMRAQIKGLDTAQKNAQDGISLVQTAEGAMTEVHSMLNRMVELATQSANGTYKNETDRENLQKEVNSLKTEIDRIADSTNYNGIALMDGSMGGGGTGASGVLGAGGGGAKITFRAAAGYSLTITNDSSKAKAASTVTATGKSLVLDIGTSANGSMSASEINALIKGAGIDATVSLDKDITFSAGATTATMTAITSAEAKKATVTVGGIDFEAIKGGNITSTVQVAYAAGVEGVTVDKSNGNTVLSLDSGKTYTKDEINALLAKGGAGMRATKVGTIAAGGATALAGGAGISADGLTLQVGDTSDSFNQVTVAVDDMHASSLGISGVDIGDQDSAKDAISAIKTAINKVSSTRGDLGAIQNRLDHTINNLGVASENMSAAESRIRDVDMAKEMMDFTKNNILTQASQAMLAQANQLPQGVLQLLQ